MTINWNAYRDVVRDEDSGEEYVAVEGGYMLASEYAQDGGRVESANDLGDLTFVGRFTNVQIQASYA